MGVAAICGRAAVSRKHRDDSGQMTVEFAVAFPVFVIVAVIAVNALLFFSDCAAFDRLARESSVFGVALPVLEHSVSLTVDTYKPGVLL